MNGELYVTRLCAWAPGIENSGEWDEWAQGKREIASGAQVPDIAFTDPLFRRRLSQISRMTVQVVHGLLPVKEDTKMFFVSFRGELSRQCQINKMLIEEKFLMPAAFSLSVFNAPAALASIALGLKGGYSALYPGNNSFVAGLTAASAAFISDKQEELIFVYADEQAPQEYGRCFKTCPPAIAFAFLLTREPQPGLTTGKRSGLEPQSPYVPFSRIMAGDGVPTDSPYDFLRRLLLCGNIYAAS